MGLAITAAIGMLVAINSFVKHTLHGVGCKAWACTTCVCASHGRSQHESALLGHSRSKNHDFL